jgi:predicted acylesterase/phospholipase RssA
MPRVRAETEWILKQMMNQDGVADVGNDDKERTRIIFPGGGIFFYWQAGAVSHLRERGYDLSETALSGASAGALAATLTATNVDFSDATRLALELAEKAGVWDRPQGLQGVWGEMIETWLDELLPENAIGMVERNRVRTWMSLIIDFSKHFTRHSAASSFHPRFLL